MNRDQKAAVIEEVATQIKESEAVFAVDYRGISVPQAAELRTKLTDAGARFRVVKNTLTERAADQAGAESLKEILEGPTAFTFVAPDGGDVALAAKALAQFNKEFELLAFKGGIMNGEPLTVDQLGALSRLPAREVLHGQLVGVIASPITGLVRGLNALIAGLAIQLKQIAEGEMVPVGGAPAAAAEAEPDAAEEAPAEEPGAESEAASDEEASAEEPAAESEAASDEEASTEEPAAESESASDEEPLSGKEALSEEIAAEEAESEEAPAEEAAAEEASDDEAPEGEETETTDEAPAEGETEKE